MSDRGNARTPRTRAGATKRTKKGNTTDGDSGQSGAKRANSGGSGKKPIRLNKRQIDRLKTSSTSGERFYDSTLKGFGVAVYPSGTKSFFIDYGPRQNRRRYAIGRYGVLTVEQARRQASGLLGKVQAGYDPKEARDAERMAATFKEWSEKYLQGLEGRKREASIRADVLYLGRAAKIFGRKKLHALSVVDVDRFFEKQKEKGLVTANRALASLRSCLAAAWRQNLIPDNVARKVKPVPENPPRARVLSDEEMSRLLDVLAGIEDPHARAAFEILLATGARLSEVLNMKYGDLDLDNPDAATWRLERPKSGRPIIKPLTNEIVQIIQGLPRVSVYVIAGRSPFKPRADLKRPWTEILDKGNLKGITIHDIRRTFGLAVAKTAGLHIASKLLGHSSIKITEQVYAPLGISDLREAAQGAAKDCAARVAKIRAAEKS